MSGLMVFNVFFFGSIKNPVASPGALRFRPSRTVGWISWIRKCGVLHGAHRPMRGGRRPNGKVILDGFVLCCWFFFGGHFKYMMDRFGLFED